MVGDLTNLTDLKAWLNIPVANTTMDALLTRLITACSAYFANECNRPAFLVGSYTEKFSGNNGSMFVPRNVFSSSPITAIATLTVDGQAIPAAPDDVSDGSIFSDLAVFLRGQYVFTKGTMNCTIVYSAGLAAIPADLAQACIDACALWYRKRDFIGHDSKSLNGEVVTFTRADVPPTARNVMDQYTRRW